MSSTSSTSSRSMHVPAPRANATPTPEHYRVLPYNGRYYPVYSDGVDEYLLDRGGLFAGVIDPEGTPMFGRAWRIVQSHAHYGRAARFCWRVAQDPELAARRRVHMAHQRARQMKADIDAILSRP